jgi:formylglycine-generating enzyme required for sulfatase activity
VDFVAVAAGPFLMGDADGAAVARPVHEVWLDAFRIATTPVTNAAYARFLAATGAPPPAFWERPGFDDPDQPVVGVDWHAATAYAAWAGARLPTEAEWEKAARGGVAGTRLPWNGAPPATRFVRPPRVRATPPNPLGVYDLSGVCHEWCLDWYADDYYARCPRTNPTGPSDGTRRVSRGGAWRHADPWSAVGHRSSLPPALRYADYGFRLAQNEGATMTAERP